MHPVPKPNRMSTFTTFKLRDHLATIDIGEIRNILYHRPDDMSARIYTDSLTWITNTFASHTHCYMKYIAPDLVDKLAEQLADYDDLAWEVSYEEDMNDGACIDMELELLEVRYIARNISMPAGSFFFFYKEGEYFAIKVDTHGNLVDDFRNDQHMSDGRIYSSLHDWCQEHRIGVNELEVSVCMDEINSTPSEEY